MIGRTRKELARSTDPIERRLRAIVRRFVVASARGALWRLAGIRGIDGGEESVTAEVFAGVGFAARPPAGGAPEAIVLNVGGAKAPVVVATRDKRTLDGVLRELGELQPGTTVVHSASAVVMVLPNGTVEIRTPGGTAVPLATKADLDALASYVDNTLALPVIGGGGGTAGPGSSTAAPTATGTSVLRGE